MMDLIATAMERNTSLRLTNTHDHTPSSQDAPRVMDRRGVGHGMLDAGNVRDRRAVAFRHVTMKLLGKLPGTRFKTRLFRKVFGMTIDENVGLAGGVYIDPYDPGLVSIGHDVIIGFDTKIFVHTFTLTRQRVRPVTIGNNVMIGGFCVIAPGVTIGDGASIAPGTIVTRDVPAGAIAMGNPMEIRKRGLGDRESAAA